VCLSLTHSFLAMARGTPRHYAALPRRPPVFKFNERQPCSSLSDLPSRANYPQVSVEARFLNMLRCTTAVSTNKDILAYPAIFYLLSQSRTRAHGIGELGERPGTLYADSLLPPV
jgi:hypothetical protein